MFGNYSCLDNGAMLIKRLFKVSLKLKEWRTLETLDRMLNEMTFEDLHLKTHGTLEPDGQTDVWGLIHMAWVEVFFVVV